MILTMSEARSLLEPLHNRILDVVEGAWAEWRAVRAFRQSQQYPPMLYDRSVANYVFDAISRLAAVFAADPTVHVVREAQTFKLFTKGMCIRFKKAGEDGLGCNIKTQAAMAFMDADGALPGLPPETPKVEIVWMPNELNDLGSIFVVARDGDTLIWKYEISRGEATAPIPLPPRQPDDPKSGSLVKAKPGSQPSAVPKKAQ